MLLVASAGPAAGVLLAGVAQMLRDTMFADAYRHPLDLLVLINVVISLFNLLPAYPLDGGRIAKSVLQMLSPRASESAAQVVSLVAAGLPIVYTVNHGMEITALMLLGVAALNFGAPSPGWRAPPRRSPEARGPASSGNDLESVDVARSDDAEVTPVDRRDRSYVETFGRRDDRGVDGSEREVAVLPDELGDAEPVGRGHRFREERAAREVPEEPHLRRRAEPRLEQVCDLGHAEDRREQWPGVRLEQLERSLVSAVVFVGVCVERAGIDEERYRESSVARISSMRAAVSDEPLRPAFAARSRRRSGAPT